MSGYGVICLAMAAGIGPWLTVLIVTGVATFTARAPVAPPLDTLLGLPLVLVLGVLAGLDIILGRLPRLARWVAPFNLVAAVCFGGLLWTVLPHQPFAESPLLSALAGAAVAGTLGLARRWLSRRLDPPLQGNGALLTSIMANVVSGALTAATVAAGL